MLFLGCDPDMHAMAFAWVDAQLKPVHIELIKIPLKLKGADALLAMSFELSNHNLRLFNNYHQVTGAFAVEGQDLTRRDEEGRKPNPYTILMLASAAGIGMAYCQKHALLETEGMMPLASEWKGQVEKKAHQQRILHHAGITEYSVMGGKKPFCVPTNHGHITKEVWGGKINDGDWKHIVDAIGLAQYAATCYLDNQRKQKYLTQARTPSLGVSA